MKGNKSRFYLVLYLTALSCVGCTTEDTPSPIWPADQPAVPSLPSTDIVTPNEDFQSGSDPLAAIMPDTIVPSEQVSSLPNSSIFVTMPMDRVTNAPAGLEQPGTLNTTFQEISFQLDDLIFKSQASSAPDNGFPTEISFDVELDNPLRLHLLINSGNGFTRFAGKAIGEVTAICDRQEYLIDELEMGRNIREWHSTGDVVSSAPDTIEVWRATLLDHPQIEGHIDLLSLDFPTECRAATLNQVTIRDASTALVDSLDPAINVHAVTIEYQP